MALLGEHDLLGHSPCADLEQPQARPLTGLPNRILLRDRTGQAIRGADRELVPVALLLLDLDRFKEG